jgi:hypothetical protein
VYTIGDKKRRERKLTQQMIIRIFLIFPCEFAIADVIEVLEPLKVGHGHTPSIRIEIRNH